MLEFIYTYEETIGNTFKKDNYMVCNTKIKRPKL